MRRVERAGATETRRLRRLALLAMSLLFGAPAWSQGQGQGVGGGASEDSDGDGVLDVADMFPCDAALASTVYVPS
jgi:hypothetical protein